ncbi:hypothetical protein XELAEV_18013375mg [Xenopus laevis]|uniref:Secreted protein n=1 Tax=Xenopus laevis TaxID=8355 RepID=A0A974HYZ8_XENLA|nr:hypothetical protein XELAEV_18013375mg [Xenopus laevis]
MVGGLKCLWRSLAWGIFIFLCKMPSLGESQAVHYTGRKNSAYSNSLLIKGENKHECEAFSGVVFSRKKNIPLSWKSRQ